MNNRQGIHHITVLASDPQENATFYVKTLGLKLALKSVNQDEPGTYHLFYTNGGGEPGSSLTFFPFPMAAQGKPGSGESVAVGFSVPDDAMEYWVDRLTENDIDFEGPFTRLDKQVIRFADPDGLTLELIFDPKANDLPAHKDGSTDPRYGIRGFWSTTLRLASVEGTSEILEQILGFTKVKDEGGIQVYQTGSSIGHTVLIEKPDAPSAGRAGGGTVHHVAFRVKDKEELDQKRQEVSGMGLHPTGIIDRFVFKSVYFRSPGGVLFEMATDGPGYQSAHGDEEMGSKLFLPPWLEPQRVIIEKSLPELKV